MNTRNNIYHIFEKTAINYSSNIALVEKQTKVTYKELHHAVNNKAEELLHRGFKKGDKILVFIPMSINLYVFLLAVFKIGAVAVFVDEWGDKKRLEQCLKTVPCIGFASGFKGKLLRLINKQFRNIKHTIPSSYCTKPTAKDIEIDVDEEDIALITFTTGSTAAPKAAKRTHGFLTSQYKTLSKELKTVPADIDMIGLPIIILCNLGVGATSIIPNCNLKKIEKLNPKKIINQINENQITRIINSPFFIKKIANYTEERKITLPIKQILTGGAPVFPMDITEFKKGFPSSNIAVIYGSTEAEPISYIEGDRLIEKEKEILSNGLCVGEINEDVQLKIIKMDHSPLAFSSQEDFKRIELKDGSVGEIIVTGNHVLKDYVNNPQAVKENKINVNGVVWHRTGDAGLMKNKELFLYGRAKNIFEHNGAIISPFIFEYLFVNEPQIISGTIMYNKSIVAYIQVDKMLNSKNIERIIKEKYSIIEQVIFVKNMPFDPRHNSKIDYDKLKELYKS